MTGMADHPDAPRAVAGASAAPVAHVRPASRLAAWRTALAVLALAAVVGGLVAGVRSAAAEPSPPDLGGPILARGAAPTATAAPARTSQPMPVALAPSAMSLYVRVSEGWPSEAAEVAVRPVPLPVPAAPATTSRQLSGAPGSSQRTGLTAPPAVSPTP
jgi:hypothetical protein